MSPDDPDYINEELLDRFLSSLNLLEVKERFNIKPEDFQTRLDLQCYLIALQVTATDKDFFIPISGKPKMGKSTLGIWLGLKTVEALRKEFHVEIPEFSIKDDIYYPPISEKEMLEIMNSEKPTLKMFDRVIFEDMTLKGMGVPDSKIKDLKEGTCFYFSNMKTRKKGYNKFENEVKDIFQKSFIYDLIFTNPLMPQKNYSEFCDIIINFFDACVICQCKECNVNDPDRLIKATIIDGISQLKTSLNRAKANSVKLFMLNSVKIFKDYDFSDIKDIYPILIVNKKFPFFDYPFLKTLPEFEKMNFVPIILTEEDLEFLISELNTPADLFAYFKKRETFVKNERRPFQNERELVSYYLLNDRTFEPKYVDSQSGILYGFYNEYKNGKLAELFAKKKELDKVSYWVDDILKGAHLSYEPNYLMTIEELLKLDRIQRRQLAKRAEEKRQKAIERGVDSQGAWGITTFKENLDVNFVIYFTNKLDDKTKQFFTAMCGATQYKTKAKKVVGIAQTTSDPKITMELYFEPKDPPSPTEEEAIKKAVAYFWGEESQSPLLGV